MVKKQFEKGVSHRFNTSNWPFPLKQKSIIESYINLLPWHIDDREKSKMISWSLHQFKVYPIPPIEITQNRYSELKCSIEDQGKLSSDLLCYVIAPIKPQKVIIQASNRSLLQKPYKSNLLNHFQKCWRNTQNAEVTFWIISRNLMCFNTLPHSQHVVLLVTST